jgi:hypothetical protein
MRAASAAALLPAGYVILPMLLGCLAAGKLPGLVLAALIIFFYALFALRLRRTKPA